MTIYEALHLLELDSPTTKQKIKQSYRKLAKKFHPDRYYKLGISEACATRQFIKVKEAYDLLMSPAAADVILEEVSKVSPQDIKADYFTQKSDISTTAYAKSSDEEKSISLGVIDWLFERLSSIEKWKIIGGILDFLFILPCIFFLFILGLTTYGLLYLFIVEIINITNRRALQIIT